MEPSLFLLLSGLLLSIALIGALRRHHVILVMACYNMAVSAAVLMFATLASLHQNPYAAFHAFLIIALSTLVNLIFCGVVILIFRSRGTLQLSDFRELRG